LRSDREKCPAALQLKGGGKLNLPYCKEEGGKRKTCPRAGKREGATSFVIRKKEKNSHLLLSAEEEEREERGLNRSLKEGEKGQC